MNLDKLIKSCSLGKDLNEIKFEGIKILIGDINDNNLIYFHFNYKFIPKNQIFGTCWGNACSGALFLTNKRILGRKPETFETYRENLLKYASNENEDGGNIENNSVDNFFKIKKIYIKKINERQAKNAVMKGRFEVCNFFLNGNQWDNFSKFYESKKRGILTKNDLNKGSNQIKNSSIQLGGHLVLLIEIHGDQTGQMKEHLK